MAARGAGMVTLLLPEGCAGDSGVALRDRALSTGLGQQAAQVAGGAVRSRRWGADCLAPLAATRALWFSGPGERGKARGRTESGRPPWPGSPICREERGRREPGAGATEGAETRPNWSEVDGGKGCGWAPGRIVKGRNEEGVGYRGWAERAKTEEASILLS